MLGHRVAPLAGILALVFAGCGAGATLTTPPAATTSPTPISSPAPTSSPIATASPVTTPGPTVDPNYSGFEAYGVGTGGTDCHLDKISHTFTTTDLIRVTIEYTPSLAAGTVVTLRLSTGGVLLRDYPQVVTFPEATHCVFGQVWTVGLPAGHYVLDVTPDTAPAGSIVFDVK